MFILVANILQVNKFVLINFLISYRPVYRVAAPLKRNILVLLFNYV